MTKAALAVVVSVLVSSAQARVLGRDPDLTKGREQVRQGLYDAGIATLTEVVRRLLAAPNRDSELADAYLHLAIAYAGLGQISPARAGFVQALRRDPSIAPDPATAPPAALEAFAAARQEAASEGVLSADAEKRKGPGTKIALGVGAAAAAGVAVAVAGSGASSPAAPPRAMFVPVSTSPYIQIVNTLPDPGSTLSSNQAVSLSIQTSNPPEQIRFLYVAEALTADSRACLRGQAGPLGVGPGGTVVGTFPLLPRCPAPFTTERLEVSMQDADTRALLYRASYIGRYQVVP